jgi:acyl-CoA reductase-like NAD-dependent aldehyde dehydrogenase
VYGLYRKTALLCHEDRASAAHLDAAFGAAARAFRHWRADDEARRAALRAMADAIEASADVVAPILTAEQGKPLSEARREFRRRSRPRSVRGTPSCSSPRRTPRSPR